MRIVGIIPARMGSSRFPGKPLAKLAGRPMVEHVYLRAAMSTLLSEAVIATCDREIADAAAGFGAKAIMTSSAHERASDRIAEAAESLHADIIVMVQGDEPLVTPDMIDLAVQPMLNDETIVCTNIVSPIRSSEEFEDRNTIKVVLGPSDDILYLSREPIPTRQRMPFERIAAFKQVCIIPFRAAFLRRYTALKPTPLEQAESIDMLRALEHGYRVRGVRCDKVVQSVDTPEDLGRAGLLMRSDEIARRYPARA